MSKIKLTMSVQQMADATITAMCAPGSIERIKAEGDKTPTIKVFSIGHEGPVNVGIVGKGAATIKYFRDAVKKLHDKVSVGTKCFKDHGKDNDHEGRTAVGEVIGKKLEDISGVLHDLVAVYIKPEHREEKLDIASIEAEIEYALDETGTPFLTAIENLTGIALGDGDKHTPGCPGATLRGAMQAFAQEKTIMTLKEIQEAVKNGGHSPSDVFTPETLQQDKGVRSLLTGATAEEANETKRIQKQLDKAKLANQTSLEELQAKVAGLTKDKAGLMAGPMLEKAIEEQKLTETQAKFLRHQLPSASLAAEDDKGMEAALGTFMTGSLEECAKVGAMFNSESPGEGGGAPPDTSDPGGDMTDPKNNPLIPQ